MGMTTKSQMQTSQMAQIAAWVTGIGITLVEMQYGMDYVFTHVSGHMSTIVAWLPMLTTLARQIWH
jgi:hypothetical protein